MSQTSRLLFTRVCRRFVHTTPIRRLDPKKVEEVRIPVPLLWQACDGSGKVELTRDLRLKERALGRFSEELVYSFSANITCRTLYITSEQGIISPFEDKARIHERSMAITSGKASHFESHAVPGKHHVHLEHPSLAMEMIQVRWKLFTAW